MPRAGASEQCERCVREAPFGKISSQPNEGGHDEAAGMIILATTMLLVPGLVLSSDTALGRTAKDLVGTWS
jgi:hypothetical protein